MRCEHGFERTVVKCEICDAAEIRAKKIHGKLPTGEQYNFKDMTGLMIAEVKVESRAPNVNGNARWRCICGCGATFVEEGLVLRRKDKHGEIASCEACRPKHRKRRTPRHSRTGIRNPNLKFRPIPAEHAEAAPKKTQPDPDAAPQDAQRGVGPRWWRIELDEKGSVQSCIAVEHRGEPGERRFFYVLALDQKAAGRAAWNEHVKLEQRERRRRSIREGRCPWCPRMQDRAPGKRCSACLQKEILCDQRRRAKAAGGDVERPDRLTALNKSRDERLREHRVDVLREVRREAMDRSPREFHQWLDVQIDGGQVTAQSEAS